MLSTGMNSHHKLLSSGCALRLSCLILPLLNSSCLAKRRQAQDDRTPAAGPRWRTGPGVQRALERSHSRVDIAPENQRGTGGEYGRLERLDMDPINHPFRVDAQRKPFDVLNTHQQVVITSKESYAWILTVIIGVFVALLARFVQMCIAVLCELRNSNVQTLIEESIPHASNVAGSASSALGTTPTWLRIVTFTKPLLFFVGWNLSFVLAGGILTSVFEPHTAADGIAEIKAFINGTHVKHFLRLRTIVAKVVGTILAAAGGLASGSEGPLIHIGAGVCECIYNACLWVWIYIFTYQHMC